MKEGPDFSSLGTLVGDPARANILAALMSGIALTAGELAREAGVMPQTASSHLTKLVEARLILVEIQGRHRYFRIAGQDVATALEGLMVLAARIGQLRTRPGPRDTNLREARACYDHLAGSMGVQLYENLVSQGALIATPAGLGLSASGRRRFVAEGLDLAALETGKRPLCRACLDWSERRDHLAGSLGAAILRLILERGWAKRDPRSRAVLFSSQGHRKFHEFPTRDRMSGGMPEEPSGFEARIHMP